MNPHIGQKEDQRERMEINPLCDGCKLRSASAMFTYGVWRKFGIWQQRKCLICRYLKKWDFGRLNFSVTYLNDTKPISVKRFLKHSIPSLGHSWNAGSNKEGWRRWLAEMGLKRQKSRQPKCLLNWAHTLKTCQTTGLSMSLFGWRGSGALRSAGMENF